MKMTETAFWEMCGSPGGGKEGRGGGGKKGVSRGLRMDQDVLDAQR